MPMNHLVRRGAVLRYFRFGDALSRSTRVVTVQNHQVRRVSLAANTRFARPVARELHLPGGISRTLINAYATAAAGRPKGHTGKTKAKKSKTTTTKKKKSSAVKAKKPKRVKKELSEKQKEARDAKKRRELVKQLKVTMLEPPKKLMERPWNLAVQSKIDAAKRPGQTPAETFRDATALAKVLTSEEEQRFASIAESNKHANLAAHDQWLRRHTPLQIKDANAARRRLSKLTKKHIALIKDDRLVTKPRTSFVFFMKDRLEGGDFKHMSVTDITARIAEEWKGMTDGEKQRYIQLQNADRMRYEKEHTEVYGEAPPHMRPVSELL